MLIRGPFSLSALSAPRGTRVRVVRLEGGAPVATASIPATDANAGRSRWLPDARSLVVNDGEQGQTGLYRTRVEPGRDSRPDPKPLLTGETPPQRNR